MLDCVSKSKLQTTYRLMDVGSYNDDPLNSLGYRRNLFGNSSTRTAPAANNETWPAALANDARQCCTREGSESLV